LSDLADALDHAEFIERLPALQREAATAAKAVVGRMTTYGRSYYDDEFRPCRKTRLRKAMSSTKARMGGCNGDERLKLKRTLVVDDHLIAE
jgi:hypothetical protein